MEEVVKKQDIRSLGLAELKSYFTSIGEKGFRAKQVYEWLWNKSAIDFDTMTNLSFSLREKLKVHFEILPVIVEEKQLSSDGTVKSAFKLYDGKITEGVLIPAGKRMTACVSSQVGCSLACKFCATGRLKRLRNLDAAEIYDQVKLISDQALQHHGEKLSNIVFMGMGEPLLNYKNVLKGIELITSEEGLGMAARRITVSTAGVAKMIKKLGDDEVRFSLALSLHAANDEKRSKIMEINDSNDLKTLSEALIYFYQKTKNNITLEYIIFDNFNDTLEDAKELWLFAKQFPSKVNIIEYNPIDGGDFIQAKIEKVDKFVDFLENKGVTVNIRRSRGKDIDAACGQLANKNALTK